MPGDISLTPTQAVQIGLVWRLARRIMWARGGGNWNEWRDTDPWATAAATASSPAPPTTTTRERGLKMSAVIDQSDETEFGIEPLAVADR